MTDLFADDQNSNTVDNNKNYLEELVGDGKKFKTPEDLARAKAESDAFILRLQNETKALRDDLNARQRLEDLLDKMQNGQTTNTNSNQNNQHGENNEGTALTPDRITAMVEETVLKREQAARSAQNLAEVRSTLTQHYGSDYLNRLTSAASDLGVTNEFLNNLAASQPKALYRLLGVGQKQDTTLFAPPRSTGSVQSSGPTGGERDQTYYSKLKATDSKAYWSPKVQNEMHKDAMRLGERFFT